MENKENFIKEVIVNARTGEQQIIERELSEEEIAQRNAMQKAFDEQQERIALGVELDKFTKDYIQFLIGAEFPDMEERVAQFIKNHNRVRELEGKEHRKYKKK